MIIRSYELLPIRVKKRCAAIVLQLSGKLQLVVLTGLVVFLRLPLGEGQGEGLSAE